MIQKKVSRCIDQRIAVDEAGQQVKLLFWQEFIVTEGYGRAAEELPGLKSIRTEGGQAVNYVEKGVYEDLWKRRLTCADSDAP